MVVNPFTFEATPGYLKWRVKCVQGFTGQPTYGFAEVEFRATVGGADQASGGTAVSGSNFSGAFLPAAAFDNNTSTDWVSASGSVVGDYIEYDFASAVDVQEVSLTGRSSTNNSNPRIADIEFYDGATWVRAWQAVFGSWTTGETKTSAKLSDYTNNRWRIRTTSNDSAAVFGLSEVEMRIVAGGTDQCGGGRAYASGEFNGGFYAENAFDNSNSTDWASANGAGVGSWIAYDFMANRDIVEVVMRSRSSGGTEAGRAYDVEKFNFSTFAWDNVWSFSTSSWSAGETRTFTKP